MKKVLVPLAQGCEEIETVVIVDVLRRAGWDVHLVGLVPGTVTASRGVKIEPDKIWDNVNFKI